MKTSSKFATGNQLRAAARLWYHTQILSAVYCCFHLAERLVARAPDDLHRL
jgi:hypothetical protein